VGRNWEKGEKLFLLHMQDMGVETPGYNGKKIQSLTETKK
jgi:hypothetical protein